MPGFDSSPIEVHRSATGVAEQLVALSPLELYFKIQVDYATRQIAVSGEFDLATAPCLATAVAGLQNAAVADMTIDLGDVSFIDAAGLGAVVIADTSQTASGVRLNVIGASLRVAEVFERGGVARLFHQLGGAAQLAGLAPCTVQLTPAAVAAVRAGSPERDEPLP